MILKCDFKSNKIIQLVFVLLMSNFVVSEVYARCSYAKMPISRPNIGKPANMSAPVTINLSGINSYVGTNCNKLRANVSYNWTSSDGQRATGEHTTLTYNKAGIYQIELNVRNVEEDIEDKSFVSVNVLPPKVTKPSVSLDCLVSPAAYGQSGITMTTADCNNLGDYIDYGKRQCKADPRSCGLFTQADIDKAKSTAVTTDKCKTNPNSCGLFTQIDIDKAKSTAVTTDKCKTNPRSCGLFTQVDIDKAKSTAITTDKCKTNPRSCSLFTQADIDKAKSTAVTTDKCKTNPHSCGLFSQADIDAANAKNTTADKCKTNPYACGLFAKTDIDKAISDGLAKGKQNCAANPEGCGINVNPTGENYSASNAILSNNLEMHIPLLTWNQFLNEEEKQLWADLIYVPSGDNRILFEVINYGFH